MKITIILAMLLVAFFSISSKSISSKTGLSPQKIQVAQKTSNVSLGAAPDTYDETACIFEQTIGTHCFVSVGDSCPEPHECKGV